MNKVVLECIPVIRKESFPPLMHYNCGVGIYKNVIIVWDQDYDPRVSQLIDYINFRSWIDSNVSLIAICESKGSVSLLWNGPVPTRFSVDSPSIDVAGDCFSIAFSQSI